MKPNYEQQLEAEIARALKPLPDLSAPASLAEQVMSRLEQRSRMNWYRRSWQTWSPTLQAASLAALLILFAGLCFAGWHFAHADMALSVAHRVGEWMSGLGAITNTLAVLLNSLCLVVKKLGTTFLIAGLFTVGLAYIMCVGLGTMCLRLAFAKQ